MNIKRAKQEIKDTVEAYLMKDEYGAYRIPAVRQRPILLIGPPGVGKTQIMEQISQERQIGLVAYTITHHTRQSAIGLPLIEKREFGGREYASTEYTMSEIVAAIYEKMRRTGLPEGILFIDEINCVSETLAPAMLQLLQGKSFGSHKVPEGWIIVAAGNPPEYNKSVRDFDVVTLDRVRKIDIEADLGVWKEYAVQAGIHPAIQSYLNVRSRNFCRIETTVDGKRFATPRGWEDLSELIQVYERLGKTVDREIVEEYLQFPLIARDFAAYLELYHKYQTDYPVDAILQGQVSPEIYEKLEKAPFDERVSVVGLVLSGLDERFSAVCRLEELLTLRRDKLREWKAAAGENGGEIFPVRLLGKTLEDFRAGWERKQENDLLSRRELARCREASALLEQDLLDVQKAGLETAEDIWKRLGERFAADSGRYEELSEEAGAGLEHAFDFMEAAFGNSQEMVLFVTELNTGFYSLRFLQGYECERYYQYNRNLLFSEEAREIERILGGKENEV